MTAIVVRAVLVGCLLSGAQMIAAGSAQAQPAPPALDAAEIADYRLTEPVYARFEQASQRIGAVVRGDSRFSGAPLFTRRVALLDDVAAAAAGLEARLQNDPSLSAALVEANLSARDYTKFVLALIGARLALGFLDAGVLQRVPPGTASDNVAFVRQRAAAVEAMLTGLGVEGVPTDAPR